ncbi:AfsR/SARP family transcriptional regulator [Streptomyces milbemycinicus]|uniref:BTAD domain-containing putative transcriptional regulator n=1 Tax=Streptomyces milbemycinicus TaxID=476552 RepID=A0ABW8LZQ1_9ACTN
MEFHLLGPLTVIDDGVPVPLGGVIKRGALAHLLIHANCVVPTSGLLTALWPGDTPLTARKMLQNAVRDLRRVLSSDPARHRGSGGRAALVTEAPGYRLRVDPETIDLFRFRQAVERGHADVAAGSYESAAGVLREALGLWRGVALADLVEDGLVWPEPTAWENTRLDALEALFEAELACGRHQAVLGELHAVAAAEPTRERLSCQMMLALYRCGRQTDALAAYRRIRVELVERYGLEPTREMQKLERQILEHAPELDPPSRPALINVATLPRTDTVRGTPPPGRAGLTAVRGRTPRPHRLNDFTVERKRITLVWVRHTLEGQGHDALSVQDGLREAEKAVREEAERFGGTMAHAVGPLFSTLFGHPETGENDAARAVRAAFAVRDRLTAGSTGPAPVAPATRAGLHVAVATGDAYLLFRHGDADAAPRVTGEVADRCFRLLALAPQGQVRVCEVTRRASEPDIAYRVGPEPPDGWEAVRIRRQRHDGADADASAAGPWSSRLRNTPDSPPTPPANGPGPTLPQVPA